MVNYGSDWGRKLLCPESFHRIDVVSSRGLSRSVLSRRLSRIYSWVVSWVEVASGLGVGEIVPASLSSPSAFYHTHITWLHLVTDWGTIGWPGLHLGVRLVTSVHGHVAFLIVHIPFCYVFSYLRNDRFIFHLLLFNRLALEWKLVLVFYDWGSSVRDSRSRPTCLFCDVFGSGMIWLGFDLLLSEH